MDCGLVVKKGVLWGFITGVEARGGEGVVIITLEHFSTLLCWSDRQKAPHPSLYQGSITALRTCMGNAQ